MLCSSSMMLVMITGHRLMTVSYLVIFHSIFDERGGSILRESGRVRYKVSVIRTHWQMAVEVPTQLYLSDRKVGGEP